MTAVIHIPFLLMVTAAGPDLLTPPYAWTASPPLVAPAERPDDPMHSVKDPSAVFYNGRWHLFVTVRGQKRSHRIEYLSFTDWDKAGEAKRQLLQVTDGYFCAPQVFFHTPQRKWYLICQVKDPSGKPLLQPAFSTTADVADPKSWTPPVLLFDRHPENVRSWIDFWVICDDTYARLFFTSNDGRMWRSDTRLADFPHGWDAPRVVLTADIFEASHTYKVKGRDEYFTLIEAQGENGRRYQKAYTAPRLDDEWRPLADTETSPFAGSANVLFDRGRAWTDCVSHAELLRAGYDERLEVDPSDVRLVFQGVSDANRAGNRYGDIPWRLGLLTLVRR